MACILGLPLIPISIIMKKLLIIYTTTEGQTAKVVRHLEKCAIANGVEVTAYNAIEYPPSPHGFDMVILAGSVHMMKYQSALVHYATENAKALSERPNAFVSVSMAAAHLTEESASELQEWVGEFEEETGWGPQRIEHVAGALKYVEYNWLKRQVMKQIAKSTGESTDTTQDHEYTDWDALDRFMTEFCHQ
ncbi:MAG: protoporphyrinogen oxidase [Flavobacteriales bacterium]|nr:protoporphyrinogen oxidase [Flavobacteriales bacterium]